MAHSVGGGMDSSAPPAVATLPSPRLVCAPVGRAPTIPRVVAFGGGTHLPVVLRGLAAAVHTAAAEYAGHRADRLSAIVTVTDDGGSSGRLRRAVGGAPPP